MRVITLTPVIDTNAYADGDAVGGLLTFPKVALAPLFDAEILGATLIDVGDQGAAMTLALFDRAFTPTANNAAYAPTDADIVNALANIVFPAADHLGGTINLVASVRLNQPIVLNGTDLFGQLFTQGTPTYAAVTNLHLKLFLRS